MSSISKLSLNFRAKSGDYIINILEVQTWCKFGSLLSNDSLSLLPFSTVWLCLSPILHACLVPSTPITSNNSSDDQKSSLSLSLSLSLTTGRGKVLGFGSTKKALFRATGQIITLFLKARYVKHVSASPFLREISFVILEVLFFFKKWFLFFRFGLWGWLGWSLFLLNISIDTPCWLC